MVLMARAREVMLWLSSSRMSGARGCSSMLEVCLAGLGLLAALDDGSATRKGDGPHNRSICMTRWGMAEGLTKQHTCCMYTSRVSDLIAVALERSMFRRFGDMCCNLLAIPLTSQPDKSFAK